MCNSSSINTNNGDIQWRYRQHFRICISRFFIAKSMPPLFLGVKSNGDINIAIPNLGYCPCQAQGCCQPSKNLAQSNLNEIVGELRVLNDVAFPGGRGRVQLLFEGGRLRVQDATDAQLDGQRKLVVVCKIIQEQSDKNFNTLTIANGMNHLQPVCRFSI